MTPRELQALILSGPRAAECAPFVRENGPAETYTEQIPLEVDGVVQKDQAGEIIMRTVTRKVSPYANDKAIADIISQGRNRLVSRMISERGVREALPVVQGYAFLRTLRELNEANEAPAWLTAAFDQAGIPAPAHAAYFDTVKCGWDWLRNDAGLDLGAAKVQALLDIIALGQPGLVDAVVTLKQLAMAEDRVTPEQVSVALRGPWGDE